VNTEPAETARSIGKRLRIDFAFSLVLIAAVIFVTRSGKGDKPRDTEDLATVVCSTDLDSFFEAEWQYESLGGSITIPKPGKFEAWRPSVAIINDADGNSLDALLTLTIRSGVGDRLETWNEATGFLAGGIPRANFGDHAEEACTLYSSLLKKWHEANGNFPEADTNIQKSLSRLIELLFDQRFNAFRDNGKGRFSNQDQHIHAKAWICARIDYLTRNWSSPPKLLERFRGTFLVAGGKADYCAGRTVKMMEVFLNGSSSITYENNWKAPIQVVYFDAIQSLQARISDLMKNAPVPSSAPKNLALLQKVTRCACAKADGLSYIACLELKVLFAEKLETEVTIRVSGPGDNEDNGIRKGHQILTRKYNTQKLIEKSQTGPIKIASLEFSASEKTVVQFFDLN